MPPRGNRAWTHRLLVELARQVPGGRTDTVGTLRYVGALPANGMVVLISDLLHPVDTVIEHLRLLRGRRHDVLVLQISDEAERTFPFDRSVVLSDLEGDREQFAVPDAVRAGYLENRQRHFDTIREACLAAEIDIEEFVTHEPLQNGFRRFLRRRQDAVRSRRRRRATT